MTIECSQSVHSIVSSYRKLRFYTIKNAPRGSHFGGVELCRLRDPPQAENPAEQDSIVHDNRMFAERAFYCWTRAAQTASSRSAWAMPGTLCPSL